MSLKPFPGIERFLNGRGGLPCPQMTPGLELQIVPQLNLLAVAILKVEC